MLKTLRFADLRKIPSGYNSADNFERGVYHFCFCFFNLGLKFHCTIQPPVLA